MTIEEITDGMAMLQASYPNMSKLDEASLTAYIQELGALRKDDFEAARREVVRVSKFFPSIAEFIEAADSVVRKRIEQQDHEEREERLALTAGEDAILDPKSGVHKHVVGPNHARFLRLLPGEEKFPEPEWMSRKKAAPAASVGGYKPISPAEQEARKQLLRQQAAMLLREEASHEA